MGIQTALYKHHTNVHVSLQFYKDVLELGDMTKLGKATYSHHLSYN